MSEWATPAQARALWPDAPTGGSEEDALLSSLLEAAQEVCEAYAPGVDDDFFRHSDRHTQAVVQQARAIWANFERDGDVLGFGDDYAVRVRPLEPSVKLLLRPKSGKPVHW